MKRTKVILFIIMFFAILLISNNVQAKNYSIEEIDMQVTLQENGDLQINQTLKYKFKGSFNGAKIIIPSGVDDKKYDDIRKQTSIVNDSFYNASGLEINHISVLGKQFKKQSYASNGQNGVYTVKMNNGIEEIKIYSPTSNSSKIFNASYTLKNVAVKHKDIGEVYYNFIGGAWNKTIKKLNIDIKLPKNTSKENLYAFAHGPYNGQVTIKDKNTVNLYVNNVKPGEYVSGRILFNLSNISKSNKLSNKTAFNAIMQEEKNIYDRVAEKERFNNNLLILAGALFVYWLILILKYERDKKYDISSNDDEMFEKYNPLIAGCIQGNRNVLSRDIIAVILDLVNKKYLKLEIMPNTQTNYGISQKLYEDNEPYSYQLTKNIASTYQLDEIESYIVDWIFKKGGVKVDLLRRLKELPKEREANEKFWKLDEKAINKLNKLGANKAKVPVGIRILNTIIFIATLALAAHNFFNTLGETGKEVSEVVGLMILWGLCAWPILVLILIIPIKLLSVGRKAVNKIVQKVNGQKVVFTTISIVLIFLIIMIVTSIFIKNKYLLVGELLICVGTLIMLTDNLMLKNDPIIAEDYSRLNALKYKIENYSMMSDKEIKEVVLWERYLTYAVAFGVAGKIAKKIKVMINDEDFLKILENDTLFNYVESDYSYFDSKMKTTTERSIESLANSMSSSSSDSGGSGFSSGSGGGFSGGGGFVGGGGRGRWRRSLLNTYI